MTQPTDNLLSRIIIRAPRKVLIDLIIGFYLSTQFILPLVFFSHLWLSGLTFFFALPVTVIIVRIVRNIRLSSPGLAKVDNNVQSAWWPAAAGRLRPQTQQMTKTYIDGLSWQEFELLVGKVYSKSGYRVEQKGGRRPDGGVDLVLHSEKGRLLVQCKHWKTRQVGVKPVRELFGVMVSEGAIGAILVTGGDFTQEAQSWAVGKPLFLVDGAKFIAQANQAQAGQPLPIVEAIQSAQQSIAPTCPVCSRQMLKRIAKSGSNAGSQFWGCPAFPRCRGTRPL